MLFEDFQDGYLNRMILAILNLYAPLIPPNRFRPNPTWGEMSFEDFKVAAADILGIGTEQF